MFIDGLLCKCLQRRRSIMSFHLVAAGDELFFHPSSTGRTCPTDHRPYHFRTSPKSWEARKKKTVDRGLRYQIKGRSTRDVFRPLTPFPRGIGTSRKRARAVFTDAHLIFPSGKRVGKLAARLLLSFSYQRSTSLSYVVFAFVVIFGAGHFFPPLARSHALMCGPHLVQMVYRVASDMVSMRYFAEMTDFGVRFFMAQSRARTK